MSTEVEQHREYLLVPPFPAQLLHSRSKRLPSAQELRLARACSYSPDYRIPNTPAKQYEVRRALRSSSSISSVNSVASTSSASTRQDSIFSSASSRSSSFSSSSDSRPKTYFKSGYKPNTASAPPQTPTKPAVRIAVPVCAVSSTKDLSAKDARNPRRNVLRLLPTEVFGSIFEHLEASYVRDGDNSNLYIKDLYSLSLSSRSWNHVSRKFL